MRKNRGDKSFLTRRQALTGTAATLGATLAFGRSGRVQAETTGGTVCVLTPEAMQGPFYFDPKLLRAGITEGKPGAQLEVSLQVVEAGSCAPLTDARVDIWQCDALGLYSGYDGQATGSSKGETFLRGTQVTDEDGNVRFQTIYPGWYPGRTPHIHFKVILDDKDLVTGQLYFPDATSESIYAKIAPYNERGEERDTFNANDFIFKKEDGAKTIAEVAGDGDSYRATLIIGVDRSRRV